MNQKDIVHLHKHTIQLTDKLVLESGETLTNLEATYHIYGSLNQQKDNVVWVSHALTSNSAVLDWWEPLFNGPHAAFSPDEYCIICVNILASCYGSTGPLSLNVTTGKPYYSEFPQISIRDMAAFQRLVANQLGIEQIAYLVGPSLGGQQALEWAITEPHRFENLILIATNAKHSPWGIAFNESQRMAIRADSSWGKPKADAGLEGMKAARATALLSYRSYDAYALNNERVSASRPDLTAASYQIHQGEKIAKRFNAYSYYRLSEAMDSHDCGRGRGGIVQGLNSIKAQTHVIGITSDVLFPIEEQKELVRHIPHATFHQIDSDYGHDGFLVDAHKVSTLIATQKPVESIHE